MSGEVAHRSRWEIFEVIFGVPFLIGIVIQFIAPIALLQGIIRFAFVPLGIILFVLGASFVILARREFAHYHQPTDPGEPTSKIVTSGVFSISRNPLYLGGIILLSGIALVLNMLWILVMLVPSVILCHYVLIVPEERYLTAKFGDEYKGYFACVDRWLGRKRTTQTQR
jgi:protein-S-isoprenylcysteine O-methyltransferase Ste14